MKPQTKKEKPYQLLTPRQEQFCHEYLKDRNGMQAAIRANYSPRSAKEQASRLLTHDNVRYRVNQLIEAQFNRLQLTADFVIRELLKSASVDIRDAFDEDGNLKPIKELPEPLARAIAGVETDELFDGKGKDRERIGETKKIKFWDKTRSLELLGKHLKMFTDVHEIPGLAGLAEQIKQARMRTKNAHNRRGSKG